MKPWMGAAAVAAAMLLVPSAALAGERRPGAAAVQASPSAAQYDDFEALGLDMDHEVDEATPTAASSSSAWVTDEQLALGSRPRLRERRRRPRQVQHRPHPRASATRTSRPRSPRSRRCTSNAAGKAGPSAAPGTVRAQRGRLLREQRRPLHLDRGQRRRRRDLHEPEHRLRLRLHRPGAARPAAYDAARQPLGQRHARRPTSTPTSARTTTSTTTRSSGSATRATAARIPPTSRSPPPTATSTRSPPRSGSPKNPPALRAGLPAATSTRTTTTAQEGYQNASTTSPTEFPNISKAIKAAGADLGLPAPAATMLGYQHGVLRRRSTPPSSARPASTYQAPTAHVDHGAANAAKHGRPAPRRRGAITAATPHAPSSSTPTAQQRGADASRWPATRSRSAWRPTPPARSPAPRPRSSPRSTPTRRRRRSSRATQVPHQRRRTASSCRASSRRSATCCRRRRRSRAARRTSTMLRIGNDKGKPHGQKVGVFLYCQEHGGEIATSGVCLETAERLVRNYGTDPETTALVDNLDIFILPSDQRRRRHALDLRLAAAHQHGPLLRGHREVPGEPDGPDDRNSYGVNINRNFSVGSVFDGFQGASSTGCAGGNFAGPFELSEPETRNEIWIQNTFREHQVLEQHPLLRRLLHVAARRLHPGARRAAVPAVRHAELLRPDRAPRAGRASRPTAARRSCRSRPAP